MLPLERRKDIMQLLKTQKTISIAALCEKVFASPATIRRDLAILAQEGVVRRIRGGAVFLSEAAFEIPFMLREKDNAEKKRHIANIALTLIEDNSRLFLDSSSSVLTLARKLKAFKQLSIVTNGNMTSYILGEHPHAEVYCTGGRVRNNEASLIGPTVCDYIARHYADLAFISCRGIDFLHGPSDTTEGEAMAKRYFLRHAKKNVLLADSTKFNKNFFHSIVPLASLDTIITDAPPSSNMQQLADQYEVQVLY